MSHTSDGENISTTNGKYSPQNWKCNSCASVRSAAKNHNTASRETKPAKWGPVISSLMDRTRHQESTTTSVDTNILALTYAQVFFISVYCSPAKHASSSKKLNEGIVRNKDVAADKK